MDIVSGTDVEVTAEESSGTALSSHDWQKAQADGQNINYIVDKLIAGQKPKTSDMERYNIDKGFLQYWNNYKLNNGVLHRETNINGERIEQLCIDHGHIERICKSHSDPKSKCLHKI